MTSQHTGISAEMVMADLQTMASRAEISLSERVEATETPIDCDKGDLEGLAIRHARPPPKIDQFTGQLERRLEIALSSGKLKTEWTEVFQRTLKRL